MNFWLQLLISVVGIIAAIVSASLTYYFTKRNQVNFEERQLKEKFYIDFIESASQIVIQHNTDAAKDHFANCANQLLLVGSPKVVNALMHFINYINAGEATSSSNKHDNLLTVLIKAMREDLYSNKHVNDDYPIIHLSARWFQE